MKKILVQTVIVWYNEEEEKQGNAHLHLVDVHKVRSPALRWTRNRLKQAPILFLGSYLHNFVKTHYSLCVFPTMCTASSLSHTKTRIFHIDFYKKSNSFAMYPYKEESYLWLPIIFPINRMPH